MAFSAGEVEATLRLRDELTAQLAKAVGAMRQAGSTLRDLGDQAKRVGTDLTMGVTAPLVALGGGALKAAVSFDTAMTKISTLSDVSSERVGVMRTEILKLAPAVGVGPKALADAMLVVTSTGMKGAEAMEILTKAAQGTSVGLGETKDIARAMTAAMTAYGKENLTATDAMNKLFVAVQEGGAEADQFATSLGTVIGIAAQMGVSFDEVAASIATYTRLGVSADEASTGLRSTLNAFMSPTKEARAGFIQLYGSMENLRAAVKTRGLAAVLNEIVTSLHGNQDALGTLFPNIRAMASILGVTAQAGAGYAEVLDHISNKTEEFGNRVKQVSETTGMKFNAFMAEMQVVAIQLGDALVPAFRTIVTAGMSLVQNVIVPLVSAFTSLPGPVQTAALAFLAVAAALGPMLYLFGSAASVMSAGMKLWSGVAFAVGTVEKALIALTTAEIDSAGAGKLLRGYYALQIPALNGWKAAMEGAKAGLAKFGMAALEFVASLTTWEGVLAAVTTAFEFLTGPVGLLIAAIGLLTLAAWKSVGGWEGVKAILKSTWEFLKDLGTIIGWLAGSVFDQWMAALDDVAARFQAVIRPVKELWGYLSNNAVTNFISKVVGGAGAAASSIASAAHAQAESVRNGTAGIPKFGLQSTATNVITGDAAAAADTAARVAGAPAFKSRAAGVLAGNALPALATEKKTSGTAPPKLGAWDQDALDKGGAGKEAKTPSGIEGFGKLSDAIAGVREKLAGLTADQRLQIQSGIDLGMSNEDIAKKLKLGTVIVDKFKETTKDAAAFNSKLADTNREVAASLKEHFLEKASENLQHYMEQVKEIVSVADAMDKTLAQIDERRADHAIEMAKQNGAAWQTIYAMERDQHARKTDAIIADLGREFRARTALLQMKVDDGTATGLDRMQLDQETAAYQAAVQAQVEDFQLGEQEKIAALRHTYDVWVRTWDGMKAMGMKTIDAVGDGLAQILTRAKGFKETFVGIWKSIKDEVTSILGDILKTFLHTFIKGLITGMAGAKGNVSGGVGGLASAFAGGGQGNGGGGGILGGLEQKGVSKVLGHFTGAGAASTTSVMTASQVAAAPALGSTASGVIAGTTMPAATVAGGATAAGGGVAAGGAGAAAGGTSAAGGGAASTGAAGGAGAGAMSMLAGPAAGALVGGIVGYKTGSKTMGALSGAASGALVGAMVAGPVGALVGAGVGALVGAIGGYLGKGKAGNRERDKFLAQFAPLDPRHDAANPPGFYGLAKALAALDASSLFDSLVKAKDAGAVKKVEKSIAAVFAQQGQAIKTYHTGGVIGGNGEVMIRALQGEAVLNRQATASIGADGVAAMNAGRAAGGSKQVTVNHYITIEGMLHADTAEAFRRKFLVPLEKRALRLNTDGLLTAHRQTLNTEGP